MPPNEKLRKTGGRFDDEMKKLDNLTLINANARYELLSINQ
jgi:hypothetical protein